MGKWGGPFAANIWGPFRGWFVTVTGLAVDGAGNVFAADFYNHRVQKFSPDGAFLTADGSVFVTDFGNHRITKWWPGKTGG